jgi:hypothetical protein
MPPKSHYNQHQLFGGGGLGVEWLQKSFLLLFLPWKKILKKSNVEVRESV